MDRRSLWLRIALLVTLLLATACQPIRPEVAQSAAQTTDTQIQNALSAAPPAIAESARVIDWPAPAWEQLVELRTGDNGWTCFPDDPGNPVNDPMCLDQMWMVWLEAVMTGSEPHYTGPGVSYMLQGGSDPSNTDPFLTQPPAGHDWNITPSHVMFVFPDKLAPDAFSTDPNSGGPYIMYQGTPYEHVMVPVQGVEADEANAQIRNAMSAAPLAIAKAATILDYPTVEGGDMVVLREGTNNWTCFTDWPVTPGNDPACYDAVWMALNDALAAGVEPAITSPGFGYMLAGGNDPSNTDPFALAPAPGEDWITTPAHLMLLVPGGFDANQFTTDHTSGYPFIMWDGTPYEHLMIPVNSNAVDMGHSENQPQTGSPINANQALATKIDTLMTKLNEEGTFNGVVLIAHNGQILLNKGYGLADREQNLPNTPTTRFRLASLTKQFTAMAILLLQEQGKLHVDDPVCQYIPDCPAEWQAMTIHHLLTHTAGVYDFRDFIYTGQTPPTPSTSAQVIERIKAQPLAFAPGEGWSYTNGGFMVAGYIVEQVSGQSYAQFLQEHIFEPLGMKNTGYVDEASRLAVGYRNATTTENPVDSSLPFAAAGLYSTVEDLYLYAQALDSGKILSPPSLETFFKQHVQLGSDNGGFSPGYESPVAYAYGWGVATFHGHRVIGHDGWIEGYGGDLRRYPDDHMTTILLMNQSEPYAALIGDQIAAALFAAE